MLQLVIRAPESLLAPCDIARAKCLSWDRELHFPEAAISFGMVSQPLSRTEIEEATRTGKAVIAVNLPLVFSQLSLRRKCLTADLSNIITTSFFIFSAQFSGFKASQEVCPITVLLLFMPPERLLVLALLPGEGI